MKLQESIAYLKKKKNNKKYTFLFQFTITVLTRKQPALEFNPHSNVIRNF